MKTLSILLLATALVCHSETSPTIKGHTLGETTQEFTAHSEDVTRGLLNACTTTAQTNVEVKWGAKCYEFIEILKTGNGTLRCLPLESFPSVCKTFDGTVVFEEGRAVEFRVYIQHIPWGDILEEGTSKFGKPDEVHVNTEQNRYGATFDLNIADWKTPAHYARLEEIIDGHLNKTTVMILVDKAYFDSKHKPHGSALD